MYAVDVHPGESRDERSGTTDNIGADYVAPESVQDTADEHQRGSRDDLGPPLRSQTFIIDPSEEEPQLTQGYTRISMADPGPC